MRTQTKTKLQGKFYECGICDCIHPWDWDGDCRDDANRLNLDDIANDAELLSWEDRQAADDKADASQWTQPGTADIDAALERQKQYTRKLHNEVQQVQQIKGNKAQHSPECKGVPHYYDGALGYEAMKCDVCGYELDLNAEANAKATAEREAREQAQHSPLPWKIMADPSYPEGLHPLHHHRYIATEAMGVEGDDFDGEGLLICAMRDLSTQEADAKLIVASVNHADKLAEALRKIRAATHPTSSYHEIADWAIRQYEAAQ